MQAQPWKIFTDTSEHYKVFQAVRGYNTGVYTKEEFKFKLKNIDLSDLENYKEHIKTLIKDVLKEKSVEKSVKEVKEVKPVETENAEIKEEVVENDIEHIVKPTISRKKNFKMEVE